MKHFKTITLLISLILILCLAVGCGKSTSNDQASDASAAESAITDSPAADSSITDSPAADDTAADVSSTEDEKESIITVTDMIGREMTITPGSFERVVCIGAGALRMYSYIGDVSLLCGVEDIDNLALSDRPAMFDSVARPYVLAYSEELKKLPSCGVGGPNAQAAEAEKILSCNPDLVISEYEDVEKADALEAQLGVPVVTLSIGPAGVFDDCFKNSMYLLGLVLDKSSRAEELVSFVSSQTADIAARTEKYAANDSPRVYICGLGNYGTTNHLYTSAGYSAFKASNIANAAKDLDIKGVAKLEEEKFVDLGESMDIMIMDAAAVKNIKPLYDEDPTMFDCCKAWREGNVYLQMAYNAYYTNLELSLANTWFAAKSVYPEAFLDIDMTEKTNEITKAFLGKELADAIFSCPSSFGGYQKLDTETFFK